MADKLRIVIEVDPSQCFDVAAKVGNLDNLGFRLSNSLLCGKMPSWSDALGLAVYGITVVSVGPKAAATPTIADPGTST